MPAQVTPRRIYVLSTVAMLAAIVAMFMALSGCGGPLAFAASGSCPVGDTETFAGNIAWRSGTNFDMTFDHTATANRTMTYPDTTGTVALQNQTLSTGSIPSSQGAIRLSNNEQIYARGAANASNELILQVDSSDRIIIGATTNDPANTEMRNNAAAFVFNNGLELGRWTSTGQWQMGQTTDPGTTSNTAHIYVKDNAGTAEVFVRDEAGNVTQISPHDPATNHLMINSCNVYSGVCKQIDLEAALLVLGQLAGQAIITETALPVGERVDWDADQTRLAQARAAEIAVWDAATVKSGLRPAPYLPRPKPEWLK